MKQLCFMRGIKSPTGFQFQKDHTVYNYVGIVGTDYLSVEPNRNGHLLSEIDPAFFEGHSHSLFVNFFKEAEAQFVVDVIKDADDLFGQF